MKCLRWGMSALACLIIGLGASLLGVVGMYQFTISDTVKNYNVAVDKWNDAQGPFNNIKFVSISSFAETTNATKRTSGEEGFPPAHGANAYTDTVYATAPGVFLGSEKFSSSKMIQLQFNIGRRGVVPDFVIKN
eukprot:gene10151-3151_t